MSSLDFTCQEEAAVFLKREDAVNRLCSLNRNQLMWVCKEMNQPFSPHDKKTVLLQLATAAFARSSVGDDSEGECEDEGVEGSVEQSVGDPFGGRGSNDEAGALGGSERLGQGQGQGQEKRLSEGRNELELLSVKLRLREIEMKEKEI